MSIVLWLFAATEGLLAVVIWSYLIFLLKSLPTNSFFLRSLPFHKTRFLCQSLIVLVSVYRIADSVISDTGRSTISWGRYSSYCLQITTLTSLIVLLCVIEKRRVYKYHALSAIVSTIGFLFSCILLTQRVLYIRLTGLSWTAGDILHAGSSLLYFLLFVLDFLTVKKISCSKVSSDDEEDIDLSHICVKHDGVHIFSKLSVSWLNDFITLGNKRPLETEDILHLPKNLLAVNEAVRIKAMDAKHNHQRSLLRTIVTTYSGDFASVVMLSVIYCLSTALSCAFIFGITSYAINYQTLQRYTKLPLDIVEFFCNGFVCVLGIFTSMSFASLSDAASTFYVAFLGGRIRAGLQALIFEKTLRIKSTAFTQGLTTGKIVNLSVADTYSLAFVMIRLQYLFRLIFGGIFGIAIQYLILGKAGFVAATLFLVIPISIGLLRIQGNFKASNIAHSDERLKLTNELLSGMRYFKIQGWDGQFAEKIEAARRKELKSWVKVQAMTRFIQLITKVAPCAILLLVMLTAYATSDKPLTVPKILTSLFVFQSSYIDVKLSGNEGHLFVSAIVACFRIQDFLNLPETPIAEKDLLSPELLSETWGTFINDCKATKEEADNRNNSARVHVSENEQLLDQEEINLGSTTYSAMSDLAKAAQRETCDNAGNSSLVYFRDATFAWDDQTAVQNLSVPLINIHEKGQLVTVVGPSGAGKTSLLAAILGEISHTGGCVNVARKSGLAYYAQKPWILHASLMRNIIMNEKFNVERYETVVKACALEHDRNLLPGGDEALIGERGLNLSGGQKARVGLARAIYSQHQLVLLDDPLSPLDPNVAKAVFREAIKGQLADKGRTVILVTHHLNFAAASDQVIIVDEGKVVEQGKWEELESSRSVRLKLAASKLQDRQNFDHQMSDAKPNKSGNAKSFEKDKTIDAQWRITEDERLRGRIQWSSFSAFFAFIPRILPLAVCLGFLAVAALTTATDYFLIEWAAAQSDGLKNSTAGQDVTSDYDRVHQSYTSYISVLTSNIAAIACLLSTLGLAGFFASRNLHHKMLNSVVAAPMSFFDVNKIGKIINRFSNDVFFLDHQLSIPLEEFCDCALIIVAALVLQIMATPFNAIAIVPFIIVCFYIVYVISTITRELMRLRNITLSPLLSHITEVTDGLMTIRSMNGAKNSLVDYLKVVDKTTALLLLRFLHFRWAFIRQDWAVICLVPLVSLIGLLACTLGKADPDIAGLAIVYSVQVSSLLRMGSYFGLLGTSQLDALNRILRFTQIEPEKGREELKQREDGTKSKVGKPLSYARLKEEKIDTCTPDRRTSAPEIHFRNVSVRYQDGLPYALANVELKVKPGSRLGLCGRTGSGKTTLVYSLFRLVNTTEGSILKDGIDITTIPLLQLRNEMTVIPQDPILFNGSVRYNLDPFQEFQDEMIWRTIEMCKLKSKISTLDDEIAEQGSNLSAGEKQLFCLARAFLRKSRVLVLDEVTSCVDLETDEVIQALLKEHFKDTTVITIAHRVRSLLNYDVVAVMRDGRVLEVDAPEELMMREGGSFRSLVDAATFEDSS